MEKLADYWCYWILPQQNTMRGLCSTSVIVRALYEWADRSHYLCADRSHYFNCGSEEFDFKTCWLLILLHSGLSVITLQFGGTYKLFRNLLKSCTSMFVWDATVGFPVPLLKRDKAELWCMCVFTSQHEAVGEWKRTRSIRGCISENGKGRTFFYVHYYVYLFKGLVHISQKLHRKQHQAWGEGVMSPGISWASWISGFLQLALTTEMILLSWGKKPSVLFQEDPSSPV